MNNSRHDKILEILYSSSGILTSEQLCSSVDVSPRTIRNDIKQINKELKSNGAEIISEKGKGYKLVIYDKDKINEFLAVEGNEDDLMPLTQEDRAEYILATLLQKNIQGIEWVTQNELSESLFISLSSLKNDMKLVREKLEKFDLSIGKISNKGMGIDGNEEDIRYCINWYVNKSPMFNEFVKRTYNNALGAEQLDIIINIVKENLSNNQLTLTDVSFKNLIMCTNISLLRHNSNNVIYYNMKDIQLIKNEDEIIIGNSIVQDIREKANIQLPESETIFITKQILASSIVIKDRQAVVAKINTENLVDYSLIEAIINSINRNFHIDLERDETLKDFLFNHLKSAIKRAKYNVKLENEMLPVIKKNHPFAFEMAIKANKIIEKFTGIVLPEGDIGFLALHFEASISRLEIRKENKLKKIIIVCSTGGGTSLLLKVKLEKYFGDKILVVDTIPWYEFEDELLHEVDFVITTIPLKEAMMNDKFIYVKNLLDSEEIMKIKRRIEGNKGTTQSLADSFSSDIFFSDLEEGTWKNVLSFMCEELIKKGYINKEVEQAIIKREKLSSTEIGNLVAIPHIMHEEIEQSFIAVSILKRSITWSKESVQLVLLIGMSKQQQKQWKSYLEQLYKKIIDIDNVWELIKSNGFNEFVELIQK